jgi:hypothetical protein
MNCTTLQKKKKKKSYKFTIEKKTLYYVIYKCQYKFFKFIQEIANKKFFLKKKLI